MALCRIGSFGRRIPEVPDWPEDQVKTSTMHEAHAAFPDNSLVLM